MNNNSGYILITTLAFVLVFMLLGFGSVHYAFVQSEIAEKEKGSTEAFWLADGAIEKAASSLPTLLPDPPIADNENPDYPADYTRLGRGDYFVYSEQINPDNWRIESHAFVNVPHKDGSVNNLFRGIEAKYGSYDIENAITTHGTVNEDGDSDCQPQGSAEIVGTCAPHDPFTFESVFNGFSYADFLAMASGDGQEFTLNNPGDSFDIEGVTVLHHGPGLNKITLNTEDPAVYDGSPAFLIVDTTGYTGGGSTKLQIAGNIDFCGIIWILGETKISGTPDILGTIFVDGDPLEDTLFTGDVDLSYDVPCISGAIPVEIKSASSLYAWEETSL